MAAYQLTFFEKSVEELIHAEIKEVRSDVSNLRKGMFSRHGELFKSQADLQDQINELKEIIQSLQVKNA